VGASGLQRVSDSGEGAAGQRARVRPELLPGGLLGVSAVLALEGDNGV